jgi:ABC-2 type transport system ATP-binding protein
MTAAAPAPRAASSPDPIVTEGLWRRFGDVIAVRDVSLRIRAGEIFGILGPNGAGKSTTIRMLCGILEPSGGHGQVAGFDLFRERERVKHCIGYMTQRFSLYDDLTVGDNLKFFAAIYGARGGRRLVEERLARSGLSDRRRQLAGTLSGGWKQRVALACATLHDPAILFLDEPTAGVDPVSRREFWQQIHGLASQGTTVVVTTHYMDEAARCHRVAFVSQGRVLEIGTPLEIVARQGLTVVELELELSEASPAEAALRQLGTVTDVSHFGNQVRVTLRGEADPIAAVKRWLDRHAVVVRHAQLSRPDVEDGFVSLVRDTEAS